MTALAPPRTQRCEGPGCEVDFTPVRSTARFHTATCRQRAARDRKAAAVGAAQEAKTGKGAEHSLVRAVRLDLEKANAIGTVDGQLALQIARRIADPECTAVSALSKELRSLIDAAKAVVPAPDAAGGPAPVEDDEVGKARRHKEEIAALAAAEAQA